MHPTAALLALRGCRPVSFQGSMVHIRVVHRIEYHAPALYLEARKINPQTKPHHYTEVPWDTIADVEWDRLLPSVLAKFLEES